MNRKIDIEVSEEFLERISQELRLGLDREEMIRIRSYFRQRNRVPTELELQALGQAWSEHCSYKTSLPFLRRFITNIPTKTEVPIMEDAGVVGLDDDFVYVVALESHNHPSAVEPYGGAATGVGGVIRDVLCMGALPIALVDGLCFAPLSTSPEEIPPGTKPPRYLLEGVVQGISDYGNRMGIPTCAGLVSFHPGYLANCLVNVGCIGIARRDEVARSRVTKAGELLLLAGGKTGRDGIHGVTFASATLSDKSETEDRSAVQVGDPITQEPLVHACLEANRHGLIAGMKDLGGGGLSCAVTEMVAAAGLGASVALEQVHLREEMEPWEIWISESQERMLMAVAPENLKEIRTLFDHWRVELRHIGRVLEAPEVVIHQHGNELARMEPRFLLEGQRADRECSQGIVKGKTHPNSEGGTGRSDAPCKQRAHTVPETKDYNRILLDLLAGVNVASRAFVIRQYDHEVGAKTITKPLQGGLTTHSPADAVVIKPIADSFTGLAITCDVNPKFTEQDPFWGAASAVDEVYRNLAAAGALPHSLADSLCLGSPRSPVRMEELEEVCRGLNFVASRTGIPFVSGNVSLYNESQTGAIPPTPILLGVGIIKDIRRSITSDIKEEGNLLFLIGETKNELGGSEYLALIKEDGSPVPEVNPTQLWENCSAVVQGASEGVIRSAHDVSMGGIAVGLAESTFGGGIGCVVDLASLKGLHDEARLFSESNSRFIVEVAPQDEERFRAIFEQCQIQPIGITGGKRIQIADSISLIDLTIEGARRAWEEGLTKYFREEG